VSYKAAAAPPFLQPNASYCDEREPKPKRWAELCARLRRAWAAGGQVYHFAINGPHNKRAPVRDERTVTHTTNSGDSVLPMAARLAIDYFLGRPHWRLEHVHSPTTDRQMARVNGDCVWGVVVGGGGLIYPANPYSNQNISGWQWQVSEHHLATLRPALMLYAVGWNRFRRQKVRRSAGVRAALSRSLDAIARRPTSVLGLRESYSLEALAPLLPLASRRAPLVYQPCATTLVGAVQPCLASTLLLEPRAARGVLSVSVSADQGASARAHGRQQR
jgi:hypothetical protein